MIKTTGLEFKRFYDDPEIWAKDAYHDELELYINDVHWMGDSDLETVEDSDKIKIGSGVIIYDDNSDADFCKIFRNWVKKQTTSILIVECPNAMINVIKAGIKTHGGRIV